MSTIPVFYSTDRGDTVKTKLETALSNLNTDKIEADTTVTMTNKTLTSPIINTGVSGTAISTDISADGTSDTKITSPKSVKTYADNISYGMARQAIMNGNFEVTSRATILGTSASIANTTNLYIMDRWKDYCDQNGGTLPTLTRSQQALTPGDILGSKFFTRLSTNGAGTSLGVNSIGLMVEDVENGTSKLCGLNKTVTISFWARSSISNKRIAPTLLQNYGSGGSPSSSEPILGTPITLTSNWTKYTATFTTNTLVGKTFGTNGDDFLELRFVYMWGTTWGNANVQTSVTAETFVGSGNIDIAQVQLCSGNVVLPFQPRSMPEESLLCQRYCEFGQCYFQAQFTSNYAQPNAIHYSVRKRTSSVVPVIYSPSGLASGKIRNYGTSADLASGSASLGDTDFRAYVNNVSVTQANELGFYWIADCDF